MAIRDIFRISRKTYFNPTGWMDIDALKRENQVVFTTLKDMYTPSQTGKKETFEEARLRLNLTEKDVASTLQTFRIYALFFLLTGSAVFIYSFYILFSKGAFAAWVLGVSVSALFFTQMFRYDFWSLQIKQRKLGLTFSDWTANLFGAKGKTS